MRSWILFLVMILILAALPATAREVTAVRLDNPEAQLALPDNMVRSDCVVGNTHAPAWAISNFLFPPEQYKLALDPFDGCGASCPLGWRLTAVHILLQTDGACDLVMSVDLEDAAFPNGPNCPVPGVVDCESEIFQVSLPDAGLWDIALPIDCECAYFDYIYLLGVTFHSIGCASGLVPDLVTDDSTAICCSYNNYGTGWEDLVDLGGFPGNLIIFGDVECCDNPVELETESWGSIKSLYR